MTSRHVLCTRALLALVLAGCGQELAPPVIRSITPATVIEGHSATVLIEADAAFPWTVSYSAATAEVDTSFTATIGGQPLRMPVLTSDGDVRGQVPFRLEPGRHDVVLTLGDGRSATLASGFEVTPESFPSGYTIDPIGPQNRQVPFRITVRAQGNSASTFAGSVELSINKGGISPELSEPFQNGVLTQEITLTAPNPEAVLTVRDAAGNEASSNVFPVNN